MIQGAIKKVVEGVSLTREEAFSVMSEIMAGGASNTQIAAFLVGLRMKGETIDEIAGSAQAMREAAIRIKVENAVVVDTCGTGGDGQGSFNVSTVCAFVVAGAGFTVAKHGNKSISSKCGSADLLEALGIPIEVSVEKMEQNLKEKGFAFLFAPKLHPAMKFAMPVRKELGIRTIFNILGPLVNPARANVQLIGVFNQELVEKLANVLSKLGIKQGMVVHGSGFDEITLTGETFIAESNEGSIKTYTIKPEQFGFKRVNKKDIAGGSKEENCSIALEVLKGKKGPYRDMVLMNAGAIILLASKAKGEDVSWEDAIEKAKKSIDSGSALSVVEKMKL
ncbi:MAG: anthranilate phosphoribosyltransferase [bacterium]